MNAEIDTLKQGAGHIVGTDKVLTIIIIVIIVMITTPIIIAVIIAVIIVIIPIIELTQKSLEADIVLIAVLDLRDTRNGAVTI